MPLTFELVALVLFSALLHASWNALLKVSNERAVSMAVLLGTCSLASLAGMFAVPAPALASWPFLVVSVILHNVYFVMLVVAYREGDLSQIYPIGRGSAPLLVAALSVYAAGDSLTRVHLAGIALISLGVFSLAFDERLLRDRHVKPVLHALGIAVLVGLYTFVDAMGLRRAGSVFGFIFWLLFLSGIPFALGVAVMRRAAPPEPRVGPWVRAGFAGLLATVSYGAALWALSLGAMAPVAALRETSVIWAAVIGALVLGEPFGRRRVIAAALVAAGVLTMNLPG